MKFVQAKYFYKGRNRPIRLVVLHTTQGSESVSGAEANANYFHNPPVKASCHIVVDNNSEVRCVLDADTAWAAPGANADGLQLEMVGRAEQTPVQWNDAYSKALLARASVIVARWCVDHKIPVVSLTATALKKGQAGITTHAEVTKAYKKSTHTDPGKNFPMVDFIKMVKKEVAAMTKVTKAVDGSSNSTAEVEVVHSNEPDVNDNANELDVQPLDESVVMVLNEKTDEFEPSSLPVEPVHVPDPAFYPYPGTLRLGSSGEDVKALQSLLNNHGNSLAVDGDFGVWTAGALQRFERSLGFYNDGILTPAVWTALQNL